ncbi:uncharacterized protein LOC123295987 [Chrysoperla carnea]|uniref:uncharacterized protein LOC123295987 n=1 Tax=Chrysoperla carnea TaxID=189513 RepID=UPI001D094562|nr:uncharacterized protein LOC123295987 [Chrysoperla carnea]
MSSYCNVCRICLTVCCDFMDIIEFAPAIMECAPIKIIPNDGYPSVICEVCLDKLQAAQHFRVLCIQSDIILRQSNDEVTIGMPNGLEHDTNSETSQEDRDDKYSHFLSCEIEYEPEILQCDTIIIDDDDSNSKDDITEVNVKNDNNEKNDISLLPKDSTSDNKENNIKKELHKIFKCKKCGQTFKTKFKFRKHHKKLHLKAIPSKKCKICSRPIKTLKNISTANTIQRSNYKNYF